MKNKKLFAILTLVCFMLTLMPVAAFATEETVITGDSESLIFTTDATITLNNANITAGADTSAISIESGNVTLIVEGTNTLTGGDNGAGIYVAEGASVTIQGNGSLTAAGNAGVDDASGAAGIGGTWANGNSGAITIDGATVIAKGYGVHGSGIGSGSGKVAGEIKIINDANVTACGGYYADGVGIKLQTDYGKNDPEGGAAIGGGGKTASVIADITIDNSTVIANGGSKAAGIGANFWSSCGTITINKSDVTAQGGSSSAGIGTSRAGDSGVTANIIISDSTVETMGGDYGAGIGAGYNGDSLTNLLESYITITNGVINATGGMGGAAIGGGYKTNNMVINITGDAKVNAKAGELVEGKTVENGGSACAIGSGANGSGTFEGSDITIAETAKVEIFAYEINGGKAAIEGFEDYVLKIKKALLAGENVTLEKDIVLDGSYIESIKAATNGQGQYYNPGIFNVVGGYGDGEVIFDLNGHTITYNGHADCEYETTSTKKTVNSCTIAHGLFFANNGGQITIKDSVGTGAVNVYGMASGVYAASPDSTITVEGGTWNNYPCETCEGTNLFLYASHGGELYIEDGYFSQTVSEGDSYLIVKHGGTAKNSVVDFSKTNIEVSGGTFNGLNPKEAVYCNQNGWSDQKWGTVNCVPEGYVAKQISDNEWIVGSQSVENLELDNTSASVKVGSTIALIATVNPVTAENQAVTWTSSDETVATVDANGVVTGVKAGTATITATTVDGAKTASCEVTVYKVSSSSGGGFSGKYNYPVNIADTVGADVTADQNYAVAGETVTITIDPEAGKQVDEVIVTDADGDVITVSKVGDNKYSFTMPAGKVNVSVTTEAADYDLRIVMQINNKNIVVNNRTITNDVAPVIVGDRTLVPVRIVTELLGGTADWDDATRTVILTIDGKVLKLVIDQPIPGFGTSATIINDRTYVPIRYVAEKLGASVKWIGETQQIIIEK